MRQDYFEFSNNVKIIAGEHSLEKLPGLLMRMGGYRIFIVSDEVLKSVGHVDAVKKVLKTAEQIAVGGEYLNIPSTFTTDDLDKLYIAYRKTGADAIVGIGGTRVMNAAKALALLISTKTKDIREFNGIDAATRVQQVPFCLIPTTFGAGNEVSRTAVIIDDEKQSAIEISSGALQPSFAILYPEFLKTLPEKELYMSLIDGLAYGVESYISARANVLTKSFSKMAMFLMKDNFQKATMDHDINALNNLQRAASIVAITYSNTYTGIVHALANSLAAKYHMHRAEAICCVIDPALRNMEDVCRNRYAEMLLFYRGTKEYSTITDNERSEIFLKALDSIITNLAQAHKVEVKLSSYGVKDEDLAEIAEQTLHDGDMIASPKNFTKEDIIEILRQAL